MIPFTQHALDRYMERNKIKDISVAMENLDNLIYKVIPLNKTTFYSGDEVLIISKNLVKTYYRINNMKAKDIIVGRYYRNGMKPGTVFMGIGKRKMWTGNLTNRGEFESKHLVIIKDENPDYLGLIFKEGNDCQDGYWEEFELI